MRLRPTKQDFTSVLLSNDTLRVLYIHAYLWRYGVLPRTLEGKAIADTLETMLGVILESAQKDEGVRWINETFTPLVLTLISCRDMSRSER